MKEQLLNNIKDNELFKSALAAARDEKEKQKIIETSSGIINMFHKVFLEIQELKKDPEKFEEFRRQMQSLKSK